MNISRRKIAALVAITGLVTGCYRYFNNEKITPAPVQQEMVLCDFHAHPSDKQSTQTLRTMLGSPGLVGLAYRNGAPGVFTYDEAKKLLGKEQEYCEITPGHLAKYREGYIMRTQELTPNRHHILAIGCNRYLPEGSSVETMMKEIRQHQGIAILSHPFVVKGGLYARHPTTKEELRIRNFYALADEVEAHNATIINVIPGLSFKDSNADASALATEYGFTGVAVSDCHRQASQAKRCGIYLPTKVIEAGIDAILEAIRNQNFTRYGEYETGPYLSRKEWFAGFVIER